MIMATLPETATEPPHSAAASAAAAGGQPLARINGTPVGELPPDLYIPPEALEVFLEAFEGPLDLLLYLIKRQNLDVLDIPITEVTRQYMDYIRLMNELRLELAADYLAMAALLAEIKSRMLMPRPPASEAGDDDEDPRAELVRRLREYEQIRQAAEALDALPRLDRDTYRGAAEPMLVARPKPQPTVQLTDLLHALQQVLKRSEQLQAHHIQAEALSVRERMSHVLDALRQRPQADFVHLLRPAEGRRGVVVTFLAALELMKAQMIELTQTEPLAPIQLSLSSGEQASTAA